MIVYSYDKDTKEYLGEEIAYLDPLESKNKNKDVYSMPANCTSIKPIKEKQGYTRCFLNKKWKYVEDHRGETVWLDFRNTKKISSLGQIPSNCYIEKPNPPISILKNNYMEKIYELKTKYAYSYVYVILNNVKYYFPTNDEAISKMSMKCVSFLNQDEINIDWKIWKNDKPIILSLTKNQFLKIYNFSMNMINECFKIENELNEMIDKIQEQQLCDESKMELFLNVAKNKFDEIKKTITI